MAYSGAFRMRGEPDREVPEGRTPEAPSPVSRRTDRPQSGLSGALEALVNKLGSVSMETDDLIMALILYLMYRESGDKDLLIMLGAMLLT